MLLLQMFLIFTVHCVHLRDNLKQLSRSVLFGHASKRLIMLMFKKKQNIIYCLVLCVYRSCGIKGSHTFVCNWFKNNGIILLVFFVFYFWPLEGTVHQIYKHIRNEHLAIRKKPNCGFREWHPCILFKSFYIPICISIFFCQFLALFCT